MSSSIAQQGERENSLTLHLVHGELQVFGLNLYRSGAMGSKQCLESRHCPRIVSHTDQQVAMQLNPALSGLRQKQEVSLTAFLQRQPGSLKPVGSWMNTITLQHPLLSSMSIFHVQQNIC